MKTTRILGLMLCSSLFFTAPVHADKTLPLVPAPASMVKGNGQFTFTERTVIAVENDAQRQVAELFSGLFARTAGFTPQIVNGTQGEVRLVTDSTLKDEAYHLEVNGKQIVMKAAGPAGFFYAFQTLRQALPAAIDGDERTTARWSVPAMSVNDAPRFGYRSFMLDVARYFMPKEELLRVVDCMAMLKLNTLHLHLTDDNGWRLEIKKYPKLTEVGAWRVDRGTMPFSNRRNAHPGEEATYGGFYTQEDMKEIVRYAAERQIEVVPEIDIPAHSNAAIASYPGLTCPVVDKYLGVLPGLGGDHADIILCAGNEKVYTFYEHVLDEVLALFPDKYIHLGGDEAWKTYWKKCPLCQKRIADEKLKDEEALQGYFMSRMSKYVQSKGRQVLGWDELTNSKVPEGAIVLGWRGNGDAALKAAKEGHSFIMTPAKVLYLIRYQGPQWFEPLTYFGNNTLKDVYDYEPVQKDWAPEYEKLLLGVQASMWTEFCYNPSMVTYQVFPRLAALAEVAWSPKGKKDWRAFIGGLDRYLAHLDAREVVYAKSMYNIQHVVEPDGEGKLKVNLECIRPDVQIRYTTDGSEPTARSRKYTAPLTLSASTEVRAATFKDRRRMGEVLKLDLNWNKATGRPVLQGTSNEKLLVNGLCGSLRQSDFEWCTWGNLDEVSFVLDLQKTLPVSKVGVRALTNYSMAVHKPASVTVEVSTDNVNYVPFGTKSFTHGEIFKEGNFVDLLEFDGKDGSREARYVRISAKSPGACPADHVRPGQPSRYYFDEVIVE